MITEEQYKNKLELCINILTIDEGKIKVLLVHRDSEPYKGYWMLPNQKVLNNETLEECTFDLLNTLGLGDLSCNQLGVFSDITRNPNERIIAINFMCIIDSKTFELKATSSEEIKWFDTELLPKMIYDHPSMVELSMNQLKHNILYSNVLTDLFPSDFTLPELQEIYEKALNKKLDRRNFRKKLFLFDLLEDTGDKNEGMSGRPAKLYRFKGNINLSNLF